MTAGGSTRLKGWGGEPGGQLLRFTRAHLQPTLIQLQANLQPKHFCKYRSPFSPTCSFQEILQSAFENELPN